MMLKKLLAAVRMQPDQLRRIPFFDRLRRAVLMSQENGRRIHYSIGSAGMFDTPGGASLSGLSGLETLVPQVLLADRPLLATAGDGGLGMLAEQVAGTEHSQVSGLTPFSYAAGAAENMAEAQSAYNLMVGHFGSEAGILLESGSRLGAESSGGSDSLVGQAILAANARSSLLGDELFTSRAYLAGERWQIASLFLQDGLRWLVIIFIIIGVLVKLFQGL